MVKRLTLGILAGLLSIAAIGGSGFSGMRADTDVKEALASPWAFNLLQKNPSPASSQITDEQTSPLVHQARAFARFLDPPAPSRHMPQQISTKPKPTRPSMPTATPAIRPRQPMPRFRVIATSYYPSSRDRSMALIAEPGSGLRWVRSGDMVGHVLVETIARGKVTWRDGERTGDVAVQLAAKPKHKKKGNIAAHLVATNEPVALPNIVEKDEAHTRSKSPKPIRRGLRPRR